MILIMTLVIFAFGILLILAGSEKHYYTLYGILLIITSIVLGTIYCDTEQPKAIDVYRGNTTIRVTYEDSIPIDTVVVFKSENNA